MSQGLGSIPPIQGFDSIAPEMKMRIHAHLTENLVETPALGNATKIIDGVHYERMPRERTKFNPGTVATYAKSQHNDSRLVLSRIGMEYRGRVEVFSNVGGDFTTIMLRIYHELGHAYFVVLNEDQRWSVVDAFTRYRSLGEFLNVEADENEEEFFGEAYASYFVDTIGLAYDCPTMHELVPFPSEYDG